jgi:hypothetical protein
MHGAGVAESDAVAKGLSEGVLAAGAGAGALNGCASHRGD